MLLGRCHSSCHTTTNGDRVELLTKFPGLEELSDAIAWIGRQISSIKTRYRERETLPKVDDTGVQAVVSETWEQLLLFIATR
jgi:hypothetical protein